MPRGYSRLQDCRSVRYHIAPIHFEDFASYCRNVEALVVVRLLSVF